MAWLAGLPRCLPYHHNHHLHRALQTGCSPPRCTVKPDHPAYYFCGFGCTIDVKAQRLSLLKIKETKFLLVKMTQHHFKKPLCESGVICASIFHASQHDSLLVSACFLSSLHPPEAPLISMCL